MLSWNMRMCNKTWIPNGAKCVYAFKVEFEASWKESPPVWAVACTLDMCCQYALTDQSWCALYQCADPAWAGWQPGPPRWLQDERAQDRDFQLGQQHMSYLLLYAKYRTWTFLFTFIWNPLTHAQMHTCMHTYRHTHTCISSIQPPSVYWSTPPSLSTMA